MRKAHIFVTVYVLIEKDDYILLLKRANTGFADGRYTLPAGHVDPDESPLQTAIRETEEEVGLQVSPENMSLFHTIYRKDNEKDRLHMFFRAKDWLGEPQNMEIEKCSEILWHPKDKDDQNILSYVTQALKHLNEDNTIYSEFRGEI